MRIDSIQLSIQIIIDNYDLEILCPKDYSLKREYSELNSEVYCPPKFRPLYI